MVVAVSWKASGTGLSGKSQRIVAVKSGAARPIVLVGLVPQGQTSVANLEVKLPVLQLLPAAITARSLCRRVA